MQFKTLLLSTVATLFSLFTFASHWSSGEITTTHLYGNTYKLTFTILRDCAGVNMPASVTINSNNGTSFILPMDYSINSIGVNTSCPTMISGSTCNGGTFPGYEYYSYSTVASLPLNNSWEFYYSSCCRSTAYNLLGPGTNFYISSKLYQNNAPSNSMPKFPLTPTIIIDGTSNFNIDYSAFDLENDSLVYSFTDAYNTASTTAIYNAGLSGTNPMNGLSINSQTGEISYTAPAQPIIGNFIINIKCEEYDRTTGTLLSEHMKEVTFISITQAGLSISNVPPVSNGIIATTGGTNISGNTFSMCLGSNANFDLSFTHPNNSVTLWSPVDKDYPGVTYSVTSVGNTSAMNVNIPSTMPQGIYRFYVQSIGDNCSFATMSYDTFTIEINGNVETNQDLTICLGDSVNLQATGNTAYTWSPGTGLSCTNCPNPTATPNTTTTYVVTGTTNNGCNNTDTITITVDSLKNYYGVVSQSNGTPYINTKVYLIDYNPLDSTVTAIDSVLTDSNGFYLFQTTASMVWLKIAPDSALYPNELPTYFDSALTFLAADSIFLYPCDTAEVNFSTISGTNPGGSGFISGNVYQGAGKAASDPMEGVELLLVNDQNEFVQYWKTNTQGYLQFSNLPYGTYKVFVDRVGVDNDLAPEIDVNESSKDISYNFKLFSDKLVRDMPNSTTTISNNKVLDIYPNPTTQYIHIVSNQAVEFVIINLNGQVLKSGIASPNENSISVKELQSGVYFIKLKSDHQQTIQKFIKK
ncbi:T9SS type A sorting domain-containing protein [bacterium SCSIO 12643]|nr:T9SS type A sorting domain-containing protein [bacterium SCSIO 12643]